MKLPELLRALQAVQNKHIDDELNRYGYTGSIADPYDPDKVFTSIDINKRCILMVFRKEPRLINVELESKSGHPKSELILTADRELGSLRAAQDFFRDCCTTEIRTSGRLPWARFYKGNKNMVAISVPIFYSIDEIGACFGVTPADVPPELFDDEVEDIEVDLEDNPLALDFPPPADIK